MREASRHYLKIDIEKRNPELAGSSGTPSRHQRRDERFERLKPALNQLSKDHREVITLSRIQGLPTTEVAIRMNRSVEATYQLLWRATKQLKEVFGDTESLRLPVFGVRPCFLFFEGFVTRSSEVLFVAWGSWRGPGEYGE